MRKIGTYNGILCYECTAKEYRDRFPTLDSLLNDDSIYINNMTGEMVRGNKVIGLYDGHTVKELNSINHREYVIYEKPSRGYDKEHVEKKKEISKEEVVRKETLKREKMGANTSVSKLIDETFASIDKIDLKIYMKTVDDFMKKWEAEKKF